MVLIWNDTYEDLTARASRKCSMLYERQAGEARTADRPAFLRAGRGAEHVD
jgi:hypothetical protein